MKLYIIRHAPAEERHLFASTGKPDNERPLTDRGIERMRDVLDIFCKNEGEIDQILHSPFKRCMETVKVLKEFYPKAKCLSTENLSPDHSAKKLYDEIQSYDVNSMAIVGHEPDLGQFISWLLFRQASDHFPMKKSGIAKMDLYKDGRTYLKWLLRPKLLLP